MCDRGTSGVYGILEYWEEEGKESGPAAFESKLRPKTLGRGEKFTLGEVTDF